MSPTATQGPRITSDSSLKSERVVTRPTREQVLRAIREDAAKAHVICDQKTARRLLGMCERAAAHIRRHRNGERYTLTRHDMHTVHRVFDAVMPDEQIVAPSGSAHELINRYVSRGSELGLVHTKDEKYNLACQVRSVHQVGIEAA